MDVPFDFFADSPEKQFNQGDDLDCMQILVNKLMPARLVKVSLVASTFFTTWALLRLFLDIFSSTQWVHFCNGSNEDGNAN
ncbi:hypothetical protein JCM31598_15630 [Desulfonatronum parangueonense]